MRDKLQGWLYRFVPLMAAVLAGCDFTQPQSIFNPKGPVAQVQMDVFMTSIWIIAGVFALVGGALLVAIVKFRVKPEDKEIPEQTHGNAKFEIGFMLISVGLLLVMEIPNIKALFYAENPPPGQNHLQVEVIGHQWWWEFRYPELGIVTANEWHIPVGRPVVIKLTTADVIHSFWAPQFAGKLDTLPNQENSMWLQADETGRFQGQCAELCGSAHAIMRFMTQVDSTDEFDQWVANEQKQAATPASTDTDAVEGKAIFFRNACIGCHSISGTVAMAKIGPDLSHFGSRGTVADGLTLNGRDALIRWIKNPPAIKPGSKMPALGLPQKDIEKIADYLLTLK